MEDPGTATTKERPLIDAAQQVRHLKGRGVRFELTDERDAERFLRESNFFFKVKAFAKCFSRYTNPDSERFGSYINLDFAYLAELTRLDHHLRETVLSLTLDIEHYMKVDLNRMVMDAGDDPYELMASFFESEYERKIKVLEKRVDLDSARSKASAIRALSEVLTSSDVRTVISALAGLLHLASDSLDGIDPDHTERSLAGLDGSSYTRGLVEKYGDPEHMAVWNYLELASFGGIISLYKYYVFERRTMKDEEAVKGLLFPTKALRNAAAHNGNMLSTLGSKLKKPVGSISKMAIEELGIDRELVSLTKRAPIVHDFTALALCYMHLVKSEDARGDAAERLLALRRRFMAHRGYFSKQGELKNGLAMLGEVMDRAAGGLSRP